MSKKRKDEDVKTYDSLIDLETGELVDPSLAGSRKDTREMFLYLLMQRERLKESLKKKKGVRAL